MTGNPDFRMGGEAAEEEAAKNKGGKFARINWFSLDDGHKGVYRFLSDSPEWIFVKQHGSVPTKNPPENFKGKWPVAMPAVCRYDTAFKSMYSDCVVDDLPILNPRNGKPITASLRVWALAVVRKEIRKDGIIAGFEDDTIEYPEFVEGKETGKTIVGKNIVVVNQGMQNFFSALQGIYGLNGTICDRDYRISRNGVELDTKYTIFPVDRVPGETRENPDFWGPYEKALVDQNVNLGSIVADRASDDYYRRFFDPRFTVVDKSSAETASSDTPPAPSQAPSDEPSTEDLEAMRARLTAYSS